MDGHFIRIKDATRLRAGDLMVLPSETGKRKRTLHLSASSYGKLGLSVGFTCRSYNSYEGVRRLLERDDGHARALVVTRTHGDPGPCGVDNSLLARFIGNNTTERPEDPQIQSAEFQDLPMWDRAPTAEEAEDGENAHRTLSCLRFVQSEDLSEATETALAGKLDADAFLFDGVARYYGEAEAADLAFSEAHDSALSQTPVTGGSPVELEFELPTSNEKKDGHLLNAEEIRDFLNGGNVFLQSAEGLAPKDASLYCPRRFLSKMQERGALFYRPSREFLVRVAASALTRVLQRYLDKCHAVTRDCQVYAARLQQGIRQMDGRVKKVGGVVKALSVKKPFVKVDRAFKEIVR